MPESPCAPPAGRPMFGSCPTSTAHVWSLWTSSGAARTPEERPRSPTTGQSRGSEGWGSSPSERGRPSAAVSSQITDRRLALCCPLPVSLDLILAVLILVGGVEAVSLAIHVPRGGDRSGRDELGGGRLARAVSYWVAFLSPGCWPGNTTYDDAGQWRRGQTGSAVQTRPGLDLLAARDLCAGLRARVPWGRFRVPGGWR